MSLNHFFTGFSSGGTQKGGKRMSNIKFDEVRATQAAAVLLKLAGGQMNYTKLIKLLYLADKQTLARVGKPLTR